MTPHRGWGGGALQLQGALWVTSHTWRSWEAWERKAQEQTSHSSYREGTRPSVSRSSWMARALARRHWEWEHPQPEEGQLRGRAQGGSQGKQEGREAGRKQTAVLRPAGERQPGQWVCLWVGGLALLSKYTWSWGLGGDFRLLRSQRWVAEAWGQRKRPGRLRSWEPNCKVQDSNYLALRLCGSGLCLSPLLPLHNLLKRYTQFLAPGCDWIWSGLPSWLRW